ncbi:MAG: VWA domain-containing protein [Promethearchaeota archaeon]
MPEIKIFVDVKDTVNKVVISPTNAKKLGVSNGAPVDVINLDNNLSATGVVEISDMALEFAGQISKNIIEKINFTGIELILRPSTSRAHISPEVTPAQSTLTSQQRLQPPKPHLPGVSPTPVSRPLSTPQPTQAPKPILASQSTPAPQYTPPPNLHPPPGAMPKPMEMPQPVQQTITPSAPVEPYPNKININTLKGQKNGIILTPVIDNNIEGGRIQLSPTILQQLGLGQGLLIAWEDPLTRANGSARIDQAQINTTEIRMSKDTKEDTNIQSQQIVVYSTEPPLQRASEILLEVHSQPNLMGFCQVSPRTQHVLSIQNYDVLAFEDELTGAIGAAKVQISEKAPNNAIIIDSEILEASGVGSFEVKVSKNQRQIIPLQSISLGISPISGENMWEIISTARENVAQLKGWISNYIIFKGIKLRWANLNIACAITNCVPDLKGDILAQVTPNTTLSLSPVGLVPFNAILIIDISRSMMARDVMVTNIAPAIEGIKAAMESREIQEFLRHFKEGVNIPRRISAAFAAVLFLSEKVGRGFGEKVAVVRFADQAQILPFEDSYYMDSASGKKGVLEDAARIIVDRIGNAYGQATNMGLAMVKAQEILMEFQRMNPNQPTMIVLLTDGEPTDGNDFFETVKLFAENSNVVLYLVGLGNPNDELMERAAALCGGEYFKPENAGDLLIWYSKRARDLTVKLKAHKK